MPKKNGLEVLPELIKCKCAPRVLILSSFEYEEEIYRAAKASARGYMTKDATRADIVDAIRAVAAGHLHLPEDCLTVLDNRLG